MILRPYQQDAREAAWNHIAAHATNPVVVIPTAGGKTPVMATMCKDVVEWDGRCMILAASKELLAQSVDKLKAVDPQLPVGIYSAGLGAKDTGYAVTVAGIQSVHQRAMQFADLNIVMIDECHQLPIEGEGMYRTFLEHLRELNPSVRVIGFTATPYRMKSGMICGPDHILNEICYEVSVRRLLDDGYITRVRTKGCDTPEPLK